MQVINITPDSFSDGGKFNSDELLVKKINEAINWKATIIDIGAESTAPFNKKITADEELFRFEKIFYPVLKAGIISNDMAVSIDTYKVKVFKEVYKEIRKYLPQNKIIFNDVSGVIDADLINLLQKYNDFDYIYSHTGINQRIQTSNHMDYVITSHKDEILDNLKQYFTVALKTFAEICDQQRIILDPCFGFSKTTEQNWILIREIEKLINNFSSQQRWLLGISRKSFLKAKVTASLSETSSLTQCEYYQTAIISNWMNKMINSKIIIRGHDPSIFKASIACICR